MGEHSFQGEHAAASRSDDQKLEDLSRAVRQTYDHAISDEKVFLYETDAVVVSVEHGVPYQIHALPSLGEKPPPSKDLPDLETKRANDPFTPPFEPAEHVCDLSAGSGYHLFLNKFCFLPMQFMLVTAEWRTQVGPLDPADLFTAWRIVDAMRAKGEHVLCFGNIGNRSGASQPHRHLQFLLIPAHKGKDGRRIPVEEVLDNPSEGDLKLNQPRLLPLPYRHTFTPLIATAPTEQSLHELYTSHLSLLPAGITSYNVLLTSSGLHVIPRAERDTVIPLPPSLETSATEDSADWKLSTNALGFAGWFFVDPGKDAVLRDFTATRILTNAGVPHEESSSYRDLA